MNVEFNNFLVEHYYGSEGLEGSSIYMQKELKGDDAAQATKDFRAWKEDKKFSVISYLDFLEQEFARVSKDIKMSDPDYFEKQAGRIFEECGVLENYNHSDKTDRTVMLALLLGGFTYDGKDLSNPVGHADIGSWFVEYGLSTFFDTAYHLGQDGVILPTVYDGIECSETIWPTVDESKVSLKITPKNKVLVVYEE